jgi:hypothetical protein
MSRLILKIVVSATEVWNSYVSIDTSSRYLNPLLKGEIQERDRNLGWGGHST